MTIEIIAAIAGIIAGTAATGAFCQFAFAFEEKIA